MIKAAETEHIRNCIRINTAYPSDTTTVITEQTIAGTEAFSRVDPLRRIAKPGDVADMVLLLASEAAFVLGSGVSAGKTWLHRPCSLSYATTNRPSCCNSDVLP